MEIDHAEARASLGEIEHAIIQTRRAISASVAAPLLMLWGLVWGAAFGLNYFWPGHEGQVWLVGDSIGIVGNIAVCLWKRRLAFVQSEEARRLGKRLFWFGILLCVYGFILGSLMGSHSEKQIAAFVVILVMFGYVVIGLWLESGFMLGLGLAVTCLTFAGYVMLTEMFNLWMAIGGGGALLISGLYMQLKWR